MKLDELQELLADEKTKGGTKHSAIAAYLLLELRPRRSKSHTWGYFDGLYKRIDLDDLAALILDACGLDAVSSQSVAQVRVKLRAAAYHAPPCDELPPAVVMDREGKLLDVTTGKLVKPDASRFVQHQIGAVWNPKAKGPRVDKFLDEITGGDKALRQLILEALAYTLWPSDVLRRFFLLIGKGANGKSTLVRLATALVGSENTSAVSMGAFCGNRFSPYQLTGKLLNAGGEIETTYIREAARLKALTGGDVITVEEKGERAEPWRIYAASWFTANQPPTFDDSSGALSDRMVVIPLDQKFGEKEIDGALHTRDELSHLLHLVVGALKKLRKRAAFVHVKSAADRAHEIRREANPALLFFDERLKLDPKAWCQGSGIYAAYKQWCQEHGHKHLSATKFYREIEAEAEEQGKPLKRAVQPRNQVRTGPRKKGFRGVVLIGPPAL